MELTPCALPVAFIRAITRSPAYRALRSRILGSPRTRPSEYWREGAQLYVIYDLLPPVESPMSQALLLFILDPWSADVLAIRVMLVDVERQHITIQNMLP